MMIRTLTMAGLLLGLVTLAPAAEVPLAVVDMESLIEGHPKAAESTEIFRRQLEGFEAERKAMIEELSDMRDAYVAARNAARDPALSATARTEREAAARDKAQAFQQREDVLNERIMVRQRELTEQKLRLHKRVEEEVRKLIAAYAQANGLGLVLDRASVGITGSDTVVFHDETLDITAAIRKRIESAAEADSGPE